jgi:glutathione S-transferase
MLCLYVTTYCPYCHKVQTHLDEAGIPYEIRNVQENAAWREEMLKLGGKMQVPFMLDTERAVSMYESDDIIAYANEHYAPEKINTP